MSELGSAAAEWVVTVADASSLSESGARAWPVPPVLARLWASDRDQIRDRDAFLGEAQVQMEPLWPTYWTCRDEARVASRSIGTRRPWMAPGGGKRCCNS